MPQELSAYFDRDDERRAYEEFCAEQERAEAEGFKLGEPALVCRWRMANKRVPLLNRHIRALSRRRVMGVPLTHNMLSWAKQHVEWSLAEGSYAARDGVLMLVIDVDGNAAMTVGEYEPLADTSIGALASRCQAAREEAATTGVAPELLGAVAGGRVLMAAAPDEALCGAADLLAQVAQTRGHEVVRALPSVPEAGAPISPVEVLCAAAEGDAALFLVSDEHGVVPAAENGAARGACAADAALAETLAADCRKLFR